MIDEKDLQSTFDDDGFADEREENAAFRLESLESYPDAVPFELEEGTDQSPATDGVRMPPATIAAIKADLETSRRRKAKPDTLELSIDRLRKVLKSTSEEVAEYTIQNDLLSVDMSGMQSGASDDEFSMADRPSLTERKKKAKAVEAPVWDDDASGTSGGKAVKASPSKRKKRPAGVAFPLIPIAAGLAGVSIIIGAYFFFAMRKNSPDVEVKSVATQDPAKRPSSRPIDKPVDASFKDATSDSLDSGSSRASIVGHDSTPEPSLSMTTGAANEMMQATGSGHVPAPVAASGKPTGSHDATASHTSPVSPASKTAAATSASSKTPTTPHASAPSGNTAQTNHPLRTGTGVSIVPPATAASHLPKTSAKQSEGKTDKTAGRSATPPLMTSVTKSNGAASVHSTPGVQGTARASEGKQISDPAKKTSMNKQSVQITTPLVSIGNTQERLPQRTAASASALPAKTTSPPSTKQNMGDVESRDEKPPVKTLSKAPERTIASAETSTLSSKMKKTESVAPAVPQPTVQSTFTSIGSISVRNASGSTARYSINVYTTAFKSDAERWLDKLQQRRIHEGYISEQQVRGRTVYNIRFGNYRSKADAESALAKSGFPTAAVCRVQ